MTKWTKEQLEAITKSGTNIIVSAGAGSGKTAVLSERVINKLESGIHINELLILTFTRAAANEMKDRIRSKIEDNPDFKDELDLLSSSYITTFDSFALSVLKKYHYLLNISNDISISDESIVLIEEEKIIDNIFDELYSSNNEQFLNMIDDYTVKNDKLIRSNILKIANLINNNIRKEDYLSFIKSDFFNEKNINSIIEEYKELINKKKKSIEYELENMAYYFDSSYVDNVRECISNLMNASIDGLALYSKVSLPSVPRGSSDEAKEVKAKLKEKLDELISYKDYGSLNDIKNNLLKTKDNINTIAYIIEEYVNRLNDYKRKNNIYTFSDVAYLSIKILEDNPSIRKELKNSFKEIMIDEYQDTNDVQDIFISLIENNNVYMVGDIKQSIYKFRGSKPKLFKEKYDLYSKGKDGYKIDLIQNFRSRSGVLTSINKIFDLLMDDSIGGASYKENHEMIYGNKTYDEECIKKYNYDIEVLEYTNDTEDYSNNEIEIFSIANDIKNKINSGFQVFDKKTSKMRSANYSDFVIILDRSKNFNDYKKVFEYFGIPATILRDDSLNTNTDLLLIRNLIDFVNCINNKDYSVNFKYDFISIARSFLYEYSDEYIFDVFRNNSFFDTSIYKDLSSIEARTPCEVFDLIIDKTEYYSKINKIGEYDNINVRLNNIYDIANHLSNMGYTITEFIDYIDNIMLKSIDIKYKTYSSSSDSVKIMTTHASKGLEYPVCYFADLDHRFNISDIKDAFIISDEYGLIIPNMNEKTILNELYEYNYLKEEISERLRLFYVALTRAREKAIVVLPYKDAYRVEKDENGVIDEIRRMDVSKLSDFIYYVQDYLPEYFNDIEVKDLGLTKEYLFNKPITNKIESNNEDFLVEEINIENTISENKHYSKEELNVINEEIYNNIKYGTKVHEYLEYLDFKNYDESIIKDEFIRRKITSFINSDLLKNIKESTIYKEHEFSYLKDNNTYNGVIDLMIEYSDHIDIIDYKLKSIQEEEYSNQLNGYREYISNLTNKTINCYLYSIIDEKYSII